MRLWLDDERPMPGHFDIHVKKAPDAIKLIQSGLVTEVSLDYHLGDRVSSLEWGDSVAKAILEMAKEGTIRRIKCHAHSSNPDMCREMIRMFREANQYWDAYEVGE